MLCLQPDSTYRSVAGQILPILRRQRSRNAWFRSLPRLCLGSEAHNYLAMWGSLVVDEGGMWAGMWGNLFSYPD